MIGLLMVYSLYFAEVQSLAIVMINVLVIVIANAFMIVDVTNIGNVDIVVTLIAMIIIKMNKPNFRLESLNNGVEGLPGIVNSLSLSQSSQESNCGIYCTSDTGCREDCRCTSDCKCDTYCTCNPNCRCVGHFECGSEEC